MADKRKLLPVPVDLVATLCHCVFNGLSFIVRRVTAKEDAMHRRFLRERNRVADSLAFDQTGSRHVPGCERLFGMSVRNTYLPTSYR